MTFATRLAEMVSDTLPADYAGVAEMVAALALQLGMVIALYADGEPDQIDRLLMACEAQVAESAAETAAFYLTVLREGAN